jgi:very-short-patch-repair endonuclease
MRNKLAQERARSLRLSLTDAERRLWHYLRRRHIHGMRFRRQVPVGPYIVDFVCLDARLAVELDGSQHQFAIAYDAQRDRFLRSRGYRVLRFWDNDVLARTQSVLEMIWRALEDAPIPTFPRRRGKE